MLSVGERPPHVGGGEDRGQDREVLGDVVGDRERRQRAARDQQLLADLDDLDQLRRIGVEVDHVAGLARRPGCRCSSPRRRRPARARARRWCRRRSSRPAARPPAASGSAPAWPRASPRRGSRRRRTPRRSWRRSARLSPVTMTVRMPIARSRSKRSLMPSLTTSLSSTTPSTCASRATASGVEPSRATRSSSACSCRRRLAALVGDPAQDRVAGALAQAACR